MACLLQQQTKQINTVEVTRRFHCQLLPPYCEKTYTRILTYYLGSSTATGHGSVLHGSIAASGQRSYSTGTLDRYIPVHIIPYVSSGRRYLVWYMYLQGTSSSSLISGTHVIKSPRLVKSFHWLGGPRWLCRRGRRYSVGRR